MASLRIDAVFVDQQLRRRGKGLSHGLVDALRTQLRACTIKPGDKLPTESEIMQTFSVSRGVVREALSRLQAAGLVQTRHGVGTFALEPNAGTGFDFKASFGDGLSAALEMLELRAGLECEAAALAATRRGQEDLHTMQSSLDDFDAEVASSADPFAADFRFHQAIAEATGNAFYRDIMASVGIAGMPRILAASSSLPQEHRAGHLGNAVREHRDIFAAIERGDHEAARAAMCIHLAHSRERAKVAFALLATEPFTRCDSKRSSQRACKACADTQFDLSRLFP